jgi:cytochrome c-type biogenesis protein CcmH/NrfG
MNQSRRQKIEAMLADDPNDVFLLYALATEMRNAGEVEPCVAILTQLTKLDTPYVPAYFMIGRVLAEAQRIAEARTALREGIEEARSQSDFHAAGEMSEFLAELGAAGE